MSSTKFVFFGQIGKTRLPPWPLIGWDIFDFSETAKRNSTKLDRKQDLNVLYVFFGPIRKTRWPPWLIPQKGATLYSGARCAALWASCLFFILFVLFFCFGCEPMPKAQEIFICEHPILLYIKCEMLHFEIIFIWLRILIKSWTLSPSDRKLLTLSTFLRNK